MKINQQALLLLSCFALFACKQKTDDTNSENEKIEIEIEGIAETKPKVDTMHLGISDFNIEYPSTGKLVAMQKADLRFKQNDDILHIYVSNGQQVVAGQLLAIIDSTTFHSRYKQAKLAAQKAEIDRRDMLITLGYSADGYNSLSENVKTMVDVRSGYSAAQNSLTDAIKNLEETRLRAPFSGTISNLDAKPFNSSSNYKLFCTLVNDTKLEVKFSLLESEAGIVSKGMKVEIEPYSSAAQSTTGTISEINPMVDENGMVQMKATLQNNGKLLDGMNVKVKVRQVLPSRIVVPKEAVVPRQGRLVVFKLVTDSIAEWNYVTTEAENSHSYCIKSEELKPGDAIITSNNLHLAHEAVVRIN